MIKKPRILLITPGFPADENDTTCIPALQIYAEGLLKAIPAFEFIVLALHYPFRKATYRWHGLTIHALNLPAQYRHQRILGFFKAWRWFRQHQCYQGWQGIHAFWLSDTAFLGRFLAKRYRLKMLATIMGQDALPTNHYHRVLRLPKAQLVAVSQRAARTYAAFRTEQPQVIPWGLGPLPAKAKTPRDIDILGVGSFIGLKDFASLIRTVAALKDAFPNIRAELIGEGSQETMLAKLIVELELENHFQLVGKLSRPEVLQRMHRAKILVHPATYEALGFVFLEALGMGMRIVSRPVGIAQAGEFWRLAESQDDFIQACESLLREPMTHSPQWPYPLRDVYRAYAQIYSSWLAE